MMLTFTELCAWMSLASAPVMKVKMAATWTPASRE